MPYYEIRFSQDCLREAAVLKFFLESGNEKVKLVNIFGKNIRRVIQFEPEREMDVEEINMILNDGLRNLTTEIIKFQHHHYSKPSL